MIQGYPRSSLLPEGGNGGLCLSSNSLRAGSKRRQTKASEEGRRKESQRGNQTTNPKILIFQPISTLKAQEGKPPASTPGGIWIRPPAGKAQGEGSQARPAGKHTHQAGKPPLSFHLLPVVPGAGGSLRACTGCRPPPSSGQKGIPFLRLRATHASRSTPGRVTTAGRDGRGQGEARGGGRRLSVA